MIDISNLEFLKTLYAGAPEGACGHVTGFDSDPDTLTIDNQRVVFKGEPVKLPLNGKTPVLVRNGAWNTYAAMGSYFGGRRLSSQLAAIHALFIDDVGTKGEHVIAPSALPLRPSWLLETAPENFQAGYLLMEPAKVDPALWRIVANGLAVEYGDAGVKDLSRYLRLPVGSNLKGKYGEPFRHVLHSWEPELRYPLSTIADAFGISLELSATAMPGDGTGAAEWANDIATGENFHESVNRLAGRYVALGMPPEEIREILEGLMIRSDAPRDERWRQRFDDIPRAISTALDKGFAKPPAPELRIPAAEQPALEEKEAAWLVPYDELMTAPPAATAQIGDILELGTIVDLFGKPASLKSFLSLSWALCVACGVPWMGREVCQAPTAYLAGEGNRGLRRRFKAWVDAYGESGPFAISRSGAALLDPAQGAIVLDRLRQFSDTHGGLGLVVVDTLARFMVPGDENSTRDMGAFVGRLGEMQSEFGCTVLVVHHVGHSAEDRGRGSSAWAAALDASIQVERPNPDALEANVFSVKTKDAEPFEPFCFSCERVDLDWKDANGTPSSSLVVTDTRAVPYSARGGQEKRLGRVQRAALGVLKGMLENGAAVDLRAWRAAADLTKYQWRDTKNALVDRGLIAVDSAGFVTLTDLGSGILMG